LRLPIRFNVLNPDSAVEMNTGIGSSGEPGGAKAEANNFKIVYRAWLCDDNFSGVR
jgi:hypothetical protein